MTILTQKTIKKKISFEGVGIHTGEKVTLNILPSEPNSGIIFKRVDLNKNNIVIPSYENVIDATLCTTISNEHGTKVSTIEHLLGAFYGLGVDNAIIELDNQEVPILDGSAKIFVEKILNCGFEYSNIPIKIIKIEKKITLEDGPKKIILEKSNINSEIDFEIKYNNHLIGTQRNKINIFENDLLEIFNSRTFCVYEDLEKLKKLGLGKGGSLENAIVVKDNKILNENGMRNDLEFVNHKILDCMGDLYLSGYKIIGNLVCTQGGHSLTNKLLRKVFENKSNYSIIEIKGKNLPHTLVNKNHLRSIA